MGYVYESLYVRCQAARDFAVESYRMRSHTYAISQRKSVPA